MTAFGDLDAEEEDALLADEDYDSYKVGYSKNYSNISFFVGLPPFQVDLNILFRRGR